jgi:hypothetical protein
VNSFRRRNTGIVPDAAMLAAVAHDQAVIQSIADRLRGQFDLKG